MTPTVRIAPGDIRLSRHAAERLDERVGGDADTFVIDVSDSLAEGRYLPAWRWGHGVFVTTERASAFVDLSVQPVVIVTAYPVETPRARRPV